MQSAPAPGRVVFVSTELHPETGGGAGVVVDALARSLAETREVLVVLAVPDPAVPTDRPDVAVEVVEVPTAGFRERSQAVARAVATVAEPGDRIEVQDFEGIGFDLLLQRSRLGLEQIPVTVRFHGPYDLLREAMETDPGDWAVPAAMERGVYLMADQVLIPAEGHRETMTGRYRVDPDRVVLAPPPVPDLEGSAEPPGQRPVFAAVGRLGEMKGSQDLVRAAVGLLEEGREFEIRFLGGDGWSPTSGTPMREWLESLIPEGHRAAFSFRGAFPRPALPELLGGVTAVVVPSRFESFCLVAHEARRLGLPVIVPDLPAFDGLFDETRGALVYDGSVPALAAVMRSILDEPELRTALAGAPVPDPGDPWAAYAVDPEPRHPRSQAGLATEASKVVEAAGQHESGERSDLLAAIYRRIPPSLARMAARMAPGFLKDRLRARAYWPEEQARRQRDRRLAAVERRIASGEFPELESPRVTVVVPVHDDVRYLEETLASVYEQGFASWEIVVVDDGSTDPAAIDFLDHLERPRLRLLRQENMGLPGARNAGMRVARGEFLVPLDSDDELEPAFLERLVPALETSPGAAYAHCLARLHGDIEALWIPRPFNPYWQLLGNGVIGCVLLRAEAWRAMGGYDETMTSGNEDWELWVRLLGAGWDQVRVDEPLFRYRKHGVSMSVSTEGRFEEGRRMVRDRHPGLYQQTSLRERKRRWYPLLTLIGLSDPPLPDSEAVAAATGLSDTWGKYVVDVTGLDPIPLQLLERMADRLEAEPKAAVARTTGRPPLVMTRRWVIHDPDADADRVITVDDPTPGPSTPPLQPGSLLRLGWVTPPDLVVADVPVQRQRPEEEGRLPDPSRW